MPFITFQLMYHKMVGPPLDNCLLITIPRQPTVRNDLLAISLDKGLFANKVPSIAWPLAVYNPVQICSKLQGSLYIPFPISDIPIPTVFPTVSTNRPTMGQQSVLLWTLPPILLTSDTVTLPTFVLTMTFTNVRTDIFSLFIFNIVV